MKKIKFVSVALLLTIGCNSVKSKLNETMDQVKYADKNIPEMTEQDWVEFELKVNDLNKDLELNRHNYTDEQIKEI